MWSGVPKVGRQTQQTPRASVTVEQQQPFSAWLAVCLSVCLSRGAITSPPPSPFSSTWLAAWHPWPSGRCPVLTRFLFCPFCSPLSSIYLKWGKIGYYLPHLSFSQTDLIKKPGSRLHSITLGVVIWRYVASLFGYSQLWKLSQTCCKTKKQAIN